MTSTDTALLRDRARGCLLGQFIGDSLGSLVEFNSARQIAQRYPDGVRDMADGGTWDLIAGQPTDDSQMAMMLIRSLQRRGIFDAEDVFTGYVYWYSTGPFDIGGTCAVALSGGPINADSQANGALMRVSPLGVYGARSDVDLATAVECARADARLTHPHPVCLDANAAFVAALVTGIQGGSPEQMIEAMEATATEAPVLEAIAAVRQLLLVNDPESALIEAVGMGGDTDTNAAIAGALLGAAHGATAWPSRWVDTVLECRPEGGAPGVRHPLGREFWATELLAQADELAGVAD
ncbi:ADP-ribosylglycohydrolase family protein [Corynebacterium testudinoris]|uniref:ADP-ribosylglycohydrolase n=1 Tax=Corynebacterium testudinoris TaxID=136857 RepID=A0A0G3HCT7_9CORY|nr:ADP-ribosylglycohydrolase family protein [Corynebacterium testudinoris]AKK08987.1 ADP-ribosylglycohydrolase [Corynebacterium testudinoris]MBX8995392.1 ADP-ribosylglycohydrolase family protein [Corynebacterium testudinoris]